MHGDHGGSAPGRPSLAGSVGAAAYDDQERVPSLADLEGDVASVATD
jgi:hypothetical protein